MATTPKTRSPSGSARRLSRDQRIEQLLDVAEQRFATHGYDGTSIEQLARAAGISRPIIYEHFGSKDGIYLACLKRSRAELDEKIANSVVGVEDLEDRLRAGMDAAFEFIEADPARWSVLFNGVALTGPVAEEALQMRFATVGAIADLLHAAKPDAPRRQVEAFAHALSGAAEQLERWWRRTPDMSRQEVVEHLHSLAWQGLRQLLVDVKDERVSG